MTAMADALQAFVMARWQRREKPASALKVAENTAARCPVHPEYPKPCQRCSRIFAEARKQAITQNRAAQIETHEKWSRERREKRERGTR